jgi:hypothetical protein
MVWAPHAERMAHTRATGMRFTLVGVLSVMHRGIPLSPARTGAEGSWR